MKTTYKILTAGLLFLALGFTGWYMRDSSLFVNEQPLLPGSSRKSVVVKDATIQGAPTQLNIPSLSMTLPIQNGVYNPRTKQWTLSLNEAQYATVTPMPNNKAGNTFIYGHYRTEVFERLHDIQAGAQAIVSTGNGHTFTYQLTSAHITNPSDTSLFKYQGPPILTIQTCSGLFFQNRQLFTFKLVNAV
jgi:LPXTG-site transpeptidase (sortase) family protein